MAAKSMMQDEGSLRR